MASEKYIAPELNLRAFHCPICGVYANQYWRTLLWNQSPPALITDWKTATCTHCSAASFWRLDQMIFPVAGTAPLPNADLPDDIRRDYEEARAIVSSSPRGAAALLRLAIQKLCRHLGEAGNNPNEDIASLVRKGLPSGVQKALDAVRVIGNEAVHPGVIDLRDDPQMAASLFGLVNFVTEKMISEPKQIDAIYAALPESKLKSIEKRDGKA